MNPSSQPRRAQPLEVTDWLNTDHPIELDSLVGKVVVIYAFQMLCPGCVMHGLPQAAKVSRLYPKDEVQVIGLHSVFEHHDVMTVPALKTFVSEYGYNFPIAVDKPADVGPTPITMSNYAMRGTPTVILIDKAGSLRFQRFGQLTDMQIGSYIGRLLTESGPDHQDLSTTGSESDTDGCTSEGCKA